MTSLIGSLSQNFPNFALKPVDLFHISLTKTVILKHHWIESFIQSIKECIANIKRYLVLLYLRKMLYIFIFRFFVIFDSFKVYCNEERTRTFIGLQTVTAFDTLMKLVNTLNGCLGEFRLPEFYKVINT